MKKIYVNAFQLNYAVPPGETLRETIAAHGVSRAELAKRTKMSLMTIDEIITAKAAITAETALQLERALGVPASFWNNRERNYQETLARMRRGGQLRTHDNSH